MGGRRPETPHDFEFTLQRTKVNRNLPSGYIYSP
jgi:hypothetical protein